MRHHGSAGRWPAMPGNPWAFRWCADSWLDQYKRILKLFEQNLK
ncbi:hypothetical protein ACTXG9_03300 [Stenotrophomonas maltophilia group sp. LNF247]